MNAMIERKNINRGYKKLEVWNDAIQLYSLVCKHLSKVPYVHQKSVSNTLDAAHSIIRNIPEGYCRRSLKEYITFLYYALGSCGELHSALIALQAANVISLETFNAIDEVQYKVENKLIKLTESLQRKLQNGEEWSENFIQPSINPPIQSSKT